MKNPCIIPSNCHDKKIMTFVCYGCFPFRQSCSSKIFIFFFSRFNFKIISNATFIFCCYICRAFSNFNFNEILVM